MNKGLESLERIKKVKVDDNELRFPCFLQFHPKLHADIEIVEQELTNYYEGIKNAETYVTRNGKEALFGLECLALKGCHKPYWKLPKQLADDVRKELKAKEKAERLIKKLFESGYLKERYGQLETAETNCHVSYPLNEEETKFLTNYFGGKKL